VFFSLSAGGINLNQESIQITFTLLAVTGILFSLWLVYREIRKNRKAEIFNELLTVEELESHAKQSAMEHDIADNPNPLGFPLERMNGNYDFILGVYKSLNDDISRQRSVPASAEWLLDNFYVIEEQVKNIRVELNSDEYHRLPTLKSGNLKGYTRVYAIAMELVSHSDGLIEEDTILKYLTAYQTHSVLTDREIWAIPTMVRLALIEDVRNISQKIKATRLQWRMADDIVDKTWMVENERAELMIELLKGKVDSLYAENLSYIEHLFYRLRRSGKSYINVLRFIDETLMKYKTSTEMIAQMEHNVQALSTVSIGNCVMSLKYVATHNWTHLFEEASYVEKILMSDPDQTYPNMDMNSRNHYRMEIEKIAKRYGASELNIAKDAITLAQGAYALPEGTELKQLRSHVGYYLIGNGLHLLEKRQTGAMRQKRKIARVFAQHPGTVYVGFILSITLLIVAAAVLYTLMQYPSPSLWILLLAGLAVLLPASEIAITFVNWIVTKVQKPTVFVRLELKEGIPDNLRTIVVIPAIISNEKRVAELLETMENHYISNREKNLYFALIGAFKDFGEAKADDDGKILRATFDGIRNLNRKYAQNESDIFYFYHRIRKYNESDDNWTGWERKRGALMEFNDILLGRSDTSFSFYSNVILPANNIKYVITLDADTVLPMGMAKKMIATMAHPLNIPVVDEAKGIVTQGHGLMQPRVSFDIDSSNRSMFSRIYTGQEGIDPYASAISDVYQDLFGEGIFTGKGIYDLQVFQRVLKDAIPINAVLSHDLLEGSYVRAALVNDLELVDSYPSKYNSFAARMYRWIRGDWQLIPWLGSHPYNRKQQRPKNTLSSLSIWKILDNLRRSLISSSILLLIFLGFSILPGQSTVWLVFALLPLALPFLMAGFDRIMSGKFLPNPIKRHMPGFFGLKASLSQFLLRIAFLSYQSNLALSAIFVTLRRVLVTKKNMLEWVTSADAEKAQDNSLKSYLSTMGFSSLTGVLLVVVTFVFKPESLPLSAVFLLIWLAAPVLAFNFSKDDQYEKQKISAADQLELHRIARKTWRYFEEFSNAKNNYLAPDNYQEDPPRGIAFRTSPTDIGLGLLAILSARDFGYIDTVDLFDMLGNTMGTLDKLEKWNGHIYNWYDTRTLKPLLPIYVSTVDSGNFVCYLVTLIQGLNVYLDQPLVDETYIEGIRDTLLNGLQDASVFAKEFACFDDVMSDGNLDLVLWGKALHAFFDAGHVAAITKQPWRYKLDGMGQKYLNNLNRYAAWVKLADKITPDAFPESMGTTFGELKAMLHLNVRLKDRKEFFALVAQRIETLNQSITQEHRTGSVWLNDLKLAMLESNSAIDTFMVKAQELVKRLEKLSWDTKFIGLYDERKQLFSIGYNVTDQKLTNSYYDLLASESRQTSYLAIARGEIEPKHWFMLGRSLTVVDRYKGLVSWSGTMFEYLMPLLIMRSYRNTLLDETYSFVIKSQMKYGKQLNMPWGSSESAFNSLDMHLDYQYKAIGIPWLGLKRGLIDDAVSTPYASFLALMVAPYQATENLKYLQSEGMEGAYGFYEAADYTPERLGFETRRVLIKSYMAHHQGMSLMAMNNALNDDLMQRRFHADPFMKAAQLLLQEKVPLNVVFTKETKEKPVPVKETATQDQGSLRKFTKPDFALPNVHILSNGIYSVMLSDKGTGYSKDKMAAITRYREDAVLDHYGMFFYLKNLSDNSIWSATYAPLNRMPDKYEVLFTPDKAAYKRMDNQIETTSEIVVTSGDHAEVRRIRLVNHGDQSTELEITSYFELVLTSQNADLAHPAFSNLFIETEYQASHHSLIAHRRPRSDTDHKLWIATTLVSDLHRIDEVQYETDRMAFIGRNRDLKNPQAVLRSKPLTNSVGPVLDPIFSLRAKVRLEPGKTTQLYFVTSLAESKEALSNLIEKYAVAETCETAFWLALTRSQAETRYLNLKPDEMQLYQEMISHIVYLSPLRKNIAAAIQANRKGQSDLWAFGISGDNPIILVTLDRTEEVTILYEVLKAHEYLRLKDVQVDLVIVSNEESSYFNPLTTLITDLVLSRQTHEVMSRPKDVYILSANSLTEGDMTLLTAAARMTFNGKGDTLEEQVRFPVQKMIEKVMKTEDKTDPIRPITLIPELDESELRYFNGLGGFNAEGNEYVIRLEKDQTTPAPWINVIANPNFGFLASEAGGGYTWYMNSRENKISSWSNDPVTDPPGEVLYLSDETGDAWSITPRPIREDTPYTITHGFGTTEYRHDSHGISQRMIQFVPLEDPVKLSVVTLHNPSDQVRTITCTYYLRPVLGVDTQDTSMHIISSRLDNGALTMSNPYSMDFKGKIAFLDASIEERSVTGDRSEFFGEGSLQAPDALRYESLSNTTGAGLDPAAVIQVHVRLEANETRTLTFQLGMSDDLDKVRSLTRRYRDQDQVDASLEEIKTFWQHLLTTIHVETPDSATNFMLNGWLPYQVISCRLWARTAFYQAGGAFGFRDQLQDSLALLTLWPQTAKEQILKHAAHQFVEGDVMHWWHEPQGKGTRTRISDDLLWLPYTVSEYVRVTGDASILDVEVPFISADVLNEFEEERYCQPLPATGTATLAEHCKRAITHALKFGEHGLPLIGTGDWNDGMNTVGNKGKGESVWLAWFMSDTLKKFAQICDPDDCEEYLRLSRRLIADIEAHAWDGNWYKRAYFDDGTALGSASNRECKIDSLAQTWAVIAQDQKTDRAKKAMRFLEEDLVVRDKGLIKLLTPPFNEGEFEPGYIKGYLPGVRENGGQYTHAAAWVIEAFALLGEGEKAWELFDLINPIKHTSNIRDYSVYKAEPYVMAADVYSEHPHIGRGGWTWYTGSAGWMYRAGLENVLGFSKSGDRLTLIPCLPRRWKEYTIRYRYLDTTYVILVLNPDGLNTGTITLTLDGKAVIGQVLTLVDDQQEHAVEATLHPVR
jgi:cyclic beta-1,2-glucan synthetase